MLIHGGRLHRPALLPTLVVKRGRRMIRADDSERPIRDAPPDLLEVLPIMPQRRRTDILGPLHVPLAAAEAVAHEVQIVRARLGVDGEQARLRLGDVPHGARRRHVDEQDGGRARDLGERDGAVRGLGLGGLGPRDGVEEGARVARGREPRRDGRDHVAVLGVHHGRDAQGPRAHHDGEQVRVAQLHGLVRHVQLDGRDALFGDEARQLRLEDGRRRVGHDHVEAVVAVGVAGGLFVVGLQGWVEGVFLSLLAGEGDHRGVSAGESAARAGFPCVACGRVVLFYVDVGVDASVEM